MEAITLEDAVILARKNFAEIERKGKRYVERQTPKWVRDNLFIPYFITHEERNSFVHIIQEPNKTYEKIFFKKLVLNER